MSGNTLLAARFSPTLGALLCPHAQSSANFFASAARVQSQVSALVIEHLTEGVLVLDSQDVVRIANPAALLLLASDGFLALASDYGAYDAAGLIAAAKTKGLAAMGAELRAIEDGDANGDRFARFKKSDDATALLLEIR